jgi:D-alanine-D-alanine ligase
MKKTAIVILFGGRSSEHEISLRSASYVLKNIPEHYDILPVGISKSGMWYLLKGSYSSKDFERVTDNDLALLASGQLPEIFEGRTLQEATLLPYPKEASMKVSLERIAVLNSLAEVFFPILHGTNGEDGRLQGLFELSETAYVGSPLRLSALAIDKDLQKQIVRANGIRVAKYLSILRHKWDRYNDKVIEDIEETIGYPCFLKPNALGSSVGMARAYNREELIKSVDYSFDYDDKVLVEENLVGSEVECSFLGDAVSPRVTIAGEIAADDFYSYKEKYSESSKAKLHVPARLSLKEAEEYKNLAIAVAQSLELVGPTRIDFWKLKETGEFVFNEVNSLPGLTSISLFPKLLHYEGSSAEMWIQELIDDAFARRHMAEKLKLSYL